MGQVGTDWKKKRIQQLKKKLRGVVKVLRDCAQQSDNDSEVYQKAHSQYANFQTQLDALLKGDGLTGFVVPVRPVVVPVRPVADTLVVQHPAPSQELRTPLYPPHGQERQEIFSDGPPTLLDDGTPTGPAVSQRSFLSH